MVYEKLEIVMVGDFECFHSCLKNAEQLTAIINYESICITVMMWMYVCMCMHTHTYTRMNTVYVENFVV